MNSILFGYVSYVHFGCPCKTWGAAARWNGCTRAADGAQGNGSLPREAEANLEVDRVCAFCAALIIAGGFSLENPAGSYLFKYCPVARLSTITQRWQFNFCQCYYGLQLPGADEQVFFQKRISVLTNLEDLCTLKQSCPGFSHTHRHESAWGSHVVQGKSVSLARVAGAYPVGLCKTWAQKVKEAYAGRHDM